MTQRENQTIQEAVLAFGIPGRIASISPVKTGHINDTYRIGMTQDGHDAETQQVPVSAEKPAAEPSGRSAERSYILQRINQNVFLHPEEVMENITAVTGWIRKKLEESGVTDPDELSRRVLQYGETADGRSLFRDGEGGCWRICRFISGASCYDLIREPRDFYEVGLAFGEFQRQLSDFPAETLHETIPDFHNTPKRVEALCASVRRDAAGRRLSAENEIRRVMEHADLADTFYRKRSCPLPVRVTHNDAKLNNIMIDDRTGEAVCILDLDTVMPGYVMYDFGDAVRSGAATAGEDETDLTKVTIDLNLYEVFAKGFLQGCGGRLTEEETSSLTDGALVITYEQAVRFLTDYLDGDRYYKISRPAQNLDRARTQLKLLEEMEIRQKDMREAVRNAAEDL